MLHRVIYASEAVAANGLSILSVAQIIGESSRNNARDGLTGCLMVHEGHIMQAIEGARADLDRLLQKLKTDPRHRNMRVLVDTPIAERRMAEPMCLCGDPETLLRRVGLPCLSLVSANDVQRMLDLRYAA